MEDKIRRGTGHSLQGTAAGRVIALAGARSVGNGRWRSKCPACGVLNRQKFSITPTLGSVLMKCFAGCTQAEVLRALGLQPRDLFDDPKKPAKSDPKQERLRRKFQKVMATVGAIAAELRMRDSIIRYIDRAVHEDQLNIDAAMDLVADEYRGYSEMEFQFERLRLTPDPDKRGIEVNG